MADASSSRRDALIKLAEAKAGEKRKRDPEENEPIPSNDDTDDFVVDDSDEETTKPKTKPQPKRRKVYKDPVFRDEREKKPKTASKRKLKDMNEHEKALFKEKARVQEAKAERSRPSERRLVQDKLGKAQDFHYKYNDDPDKRSVNPVERRKALERIQEKAGKRAMALNNGPKIEAARLRWFTEQVAKGVAIPMFGFFGKDRKKFMGHRERWFL